MIGDRKYVYDAFSRFSYVQRAGQPQRDQKATYDAYGNLTALEKSGNTRVLTTSAATNRLATPESAYTSNGELAYAVIDGLDFAYGYDGLGQQLFQQTSSKTWVYAYDANDERILTWECARVGSNHPCGEIPSHERYTLRGLAGEVLRVFSGPGRAELTWEEDFVYRDGQPLAWVKADPEGEKKLFLHADHLGSTRQVSSATGAQVARHDFLPFGEESTASSNGDIKLKFTGHERDQPGRPMDYMRARSASPMLGRFLRVDPSGESARQTVPQTWNRYTYAANNPIANQDPDGRECRMGMLLERDILDRAAGRISSEKYWERITARGEGAAAGLSLFIPGPEELVIASVAKWGRGLVAKLARKLFRGNGGGGGGSGGGGLDWDSVVPLKGKYAGQSRTDHVSGHNIDNPTKAYHGVFLEDGVSVTNEAWARAQSLGLSPNGKGDLTVPMGRQVGWLGGKAGSEAAVPLDAVTIHVVPGTNKLITAYPDVVPIP